MRAKLRFVVTVCCLLLLDISPGFTQRSFPFLNEPFGQATEPSELPRPDPLNLQPGWWNYFSVDDEQLEQHTQAVLAHLEELLEEMPEDLRESANPFIELIRANLRALPQTRDLDAPESPPPLITQDGYTVEQLLEIDSRLREARAELAEERQDIEAAETALRVVSRRVDTLLAAYLSRNGNDPQRLLQGLEIMAERSEVGVAQERLRYRQALLTIRARQIEQLETERELAMERLEASYPQLVRLATEIEQADTILKQTRERLLRDQTAALNLVANSPEERATGQFRRQRVVRSAVTEAVAHVRLMRLQAERALVSILLEDVAVDTDDLRDRLSTWVDTLQEIRERSVEWIRDSERERDRTGTAVAGTAGQPGAVLDSIRLINQDRFRIAQETLVAAQGLLEDIEQVHLLLSQVERELLFLDGRLRDWLARGVQLVGQLWSEAGDWISTSLFRVGETPVTALGLLRIVLIITVAWWISYWLRRALMQLGERREGINLSAYYTVGRLSHYLLMAIGIMVGLSSIGMDFTNFALVAGALGIGIGFGLQPIVNNFLSGLILLFERSLKVGDFVELASGVEGEVREINVRSTLINTNDNVDIVVPNSEFMSTNVVNWTLMENYRRIHLPFRVAYGTDKELVRQAGLEAAEKVPHTLTGIPGKNPGVWLVGFGDNGLEFELVVWITYRAVKRPGAVRAAYMWEIESALRKYAIQVPYPQRDLHIRSGLQEAMQLQQRDSGARPRLDKPEKEPVRPRVEEEEGLNATAASRERDAAVSLEKNPG